MTYGGLSWDQIWRAMACVAVVVGILLVETYLTGCSLPKVPTEVTSQKFQPRSLPQPR